MTAKVEVLLSAKDAEMVAAWQRAKDSIAQFNKELDQIGNKQQKNKKETDSLFQSVSNGVAQAATSFLGIHTVMTGISKAAQILLQEHEALVRAQERSRATSVSAADALRKAGVNFVPDATVSQKELEPLLMSIAQETRTPIGIIADSYSGAASSRGQLTNLEAAEAVRQSARVLPADRESITEMSERALDVANFSGERDFRQIIGFLLNVQAASRVSKLDHLGQNIVPAIGSVIQTGDTPEEAAELVSTMSLLMNDAEGRLSRSASINLANQLDKFVPKTLGEDERGKFRVPKEQIEAYLAAEGATERIAVMQQSPELRRQFLSGASFEAVAQQPIERLLSGEKTAVAIAEEVRSVVQPLDDPQQAALFEQKLRQLDKGQFQPTLTAAQQSAANIEEMELSLTRDQRVATARKLMQDMFEKVELPGRVDAAYETIPRWEFERRVAFTDDDPEAAAAESLRYFRDRTNVLTSEQRRALDAQIKALESTREEYQRRDPIPANVRRLAEDAPEQLSADTRQTLRKHAPADGELPALIREQNELLKQQNRLLERSTAPNVNVSIGGRPVDADVQPERPVRSSQRGEIPASVRRLAGEG